MMVLDVLIEIIYYFIGKHDGLARVTQLAVNGYMQLHFFLFLYFVYRNNYLGRRWFYILPVPALAICVISIIYTANPFNSFIYPLCYVSLVMLIISINILSRQIMEFKVSISRNCWFWFSTASLLANTYNLLIFGLFFFALRDTPNGKAIGSIQHFVNAACYGAFTIALLVAPEKKLMYKGERKVNNGINGHHV